MFESKKIDDGVNRENERKLEDTGKKLCPRERRLFPELHTQLRSSQTGTASEAEIQPPAVCLGWILTGDLHEKGNDQLRII